MPVTFLLTSASQDFCLSNSRLLSSLPAELTTIWIYNHGCQTITSIHNSSSFSPSSSPVSCSGEKQSLYVNTSQMVLRPQGMSPPTRHGRKTTATTVQCSQPCNSRSNCSGSSYLVTMPLGDWGALHWKEAFLEVTVRIWGGGCSEGGAGFVVNSAMGPLLQQLKQVQASTPMEYVVKGFSPWIVCWVAVPSDSCKN